MKVNELRARARVGQYWLSKYNNNIHKVTGLKENDWRGHQTIIFNDFIVTEKELKENWVHLWFMKKENPKYFTSEIKEGQIWIINSIVAFIGPNWKDTEGKVTLLSDEDFKCFGDPILYQEAL